MEIGRKIYYFQDGTIICDAGERMGDVIATNIEEDLINIETPEGMTREEFLISLSYIEFVYGETPEEYLKNLQGYKVENKTLVLKG